MAPRFIWGGEQVEAFFSVLRGSYPDYLRAKELRRMDEFYENIGACIGADGLVVQNFLKKTGRSYRNILLQAETCGEGMEGPDRKLRGSARVYRLYEEYYQMYYLGSVQLANDADESLSVQHKVNRLGGRKRKSCALVDLQALPEESKKRLRPSSVDVLVDDKEENAFLVLEDDSEYAHVDHELALDNHMPLADHIAEHLNAEEVTAPTRVHPTKKTTPEKEGNFSPEMNPRGPGRVGRQCSDSEEASTDDVFGKGADFQEQFLKLMENQNHILTNIVEELNLIRHAVLDANGLQTITYVK